MIRSVFHSSVWAVTAIAAGCMTLRGPDLGGLYDRAARHPSPDRNPVIVIPGILGSKLMDEESGKLVWGAFTREYASPTTTRGARLVALPMGEGVALKDLRDSVVPISVLDRVRVNLIGLPIELGAYANILGTLGVGGYRDELLARSGAVDYGDQHFTCFQFPYDWRRDLVESAKQLHEFIERQREYVRQQKLARFGIDVPHGKVDLVAHSMGGLVVRYYLRYGTADLPADGSLPQVTWDGARHVDKVIIVGTPNAGSVNAFVQLVEGIRLAPILPKYEAAILGTMPSIYQLMPRARHGAVVWNDAPEDKIDPFDPALWERYGWGLASYDQDQTLRTLLPDVVDARGRRAIALDHLRKCLDRARRFHEALDVPATPPADLSLYLILGDAMATNAAAGVDRRSGKIGVIKKAAGDGTVLRSSALLDERLGGSWSPRLQTPVSWTHVTVLFDDHLGLTKSPVFADNVLFLLLEQPDSSK